jgi:hypothetical protein
VYPNSPVLLFALKYMHFLLVNLLARFLILFKAGYTSSVLFVLSNFTYTIRLASHETTRKYLKPYTDAEWYLDKSACSLFTLLPSRLLVFLLNDSFILPAKQGSYSFLPCGSLLLSLGLIKLIELPSSNCSILL